MTRANAKKQSLVSKELEYQIEHYKDGLNPSQDVHYHDYYEITFYLGQEQLIYLSNYEQYQVRLRSYLQIRRRWLVLLGLSADRAGRENDRELHHYAPYFLGTQRKQDAPAPHSGQKSGGIYGRKA